jgi:hypothetical protein
MACKVFGMPTILNEPATWFSGPEAEGVAFDFLDAAVLHALAIPMADRHGLGHIVTRSVSTYGWEAIKTLAEVSTAYSQESSSTADGAL